MTTLRPSLLPTMPSSDSFSSVQKSLVDAVLICYGSERRMDRGHGRYCLEAAYLFGERRIGEEGYA